MMKHEKRVLHVINSSGLGGAETVVAGILRATSAMCFCLRKEQVQRFPEDRVSFGTTGSSYKYHPGVLWRLVRAIQRIKPDIVHVHLAVALRYVLLAKIFLPQVTIVYHEHGEILENAQFGWFLRLTRRGISRYIACSRFMKRALMHTAHVAEDQIDVIYNYYDAEIYTPKGVTAEERERLRAEIGVLPGERLIGFAARLIPRKGWREFVEAAEILCRGASVNSKFVMAGDGREREQLMVRITQEPLRSRLVYVGYQADMRAWYAMLDCFVIPSHYEPLGMTEIEAMAMGIPVIASNVDGLNEVVKEGETGWLCEPKHAAELAKTMQRVFADDAVRDAMIQASFTRVRRYQLSEYLMQLFASYAGL